MSARSLGEEVFSMVRPLCLAGHHPENVLRKKPNGRGRVWWVHDGHPTAHEFRVLAAKNRGPRGGVFRESDWFCGDGELVYADGRTWAFTREWSSASAEAALRAVREYAKKAER